MPKLVCSLVVSTYFNVAQLAQDSCYLVLRIARRVAKLILPREYFPVGGAFESAQLSAEDLNMLKQKFSAV